MMWAGRLRNGLTMLETNNTRYNNTRYLVSMIKAYRVYWEVCRDG